MSPPTWTLLVSTAAAMMVTMTSHPVSAVEPETCFSRQHQNVIVNVRLALNKATTAMDARVVRSERDCVLACCSEEVKPGAKCNMAVFNANKHAGDDNCFLFHCQTEQDCPLMKAQSGINTYDIYKGLVHPTTVRPVTTTTRAPTRPGTPQPSTTITHSTTAAPTTTAPTQPTTPSPPTTTPSPPTTTTATTPPPATASAPPAIIIPAPTPAVTAAPSTTTATTTTTPAASTATTTVTKKTNKTSKKQNKTTKKAKPHPVSTTTTTRPPPRSTTSLPVATAIKEAEYKTTGKPQLRTATTTATTTTTSTTATTTKSTTTTTTKTTTTTPTRPPTTTPTTTTTTTTTPTTTTTTLPTTTTTTEPSTTRTTPASSPVIVPKDAVPTDHALQNSSITRGKAFAAQGAVKSGVVAFMVLGLAVLTLALAVGGRKAMESFDRRHYTRLELNDLHYEV